MKATTKILCTLAINFSLVLGGKTQTLTATPDRLSSINVVLDSVTEVRPLLEALVAVAPVPFATLPRTKQGVVLSVGYWSMQNPKLPPMPGNIFGLDVWPLGDGMFVLDDRKVDYAAVQAAAELAAKLDAAATLQNTPQMRTMLSRLSTAYAYGNPVYLTNLVVTALGGMSAAFDIAGGTNNVPYDIQTTSNLLSPWNWLGIGYTSNRYAFTSQPNDRAFYRLAKPSQTMTVAWGEDYFNQCDPPLGLTNAMMIEGGGGYTVALLTDGTPVGWGGRTNEGSIPTNLTGIAMIASGIDHKVALLTNGTVLAWGANFYNQTSVPVGLTNVTVVVAQYLHTLALRRDGSVISWGDPSNPALTNSPASLTNAIAIAAGCNHNLAVKADGTVVAWGDHSRGQCTVPTGLSNVLDVAAGWAHSVALKTDGTVVVWGNNTLGELNMPTGLSNVVAIAAAGYPAYSGYTLALKRDGTVVTWGRNKAALPLNGLNNVIAIGAEYDSGLAIRTGPPTPVVTLEPVDQYQTAGSTVSFSTKGQGLYGVTYQWQTNGVNFLGATNTTLTLTNAQLAQQGSYRAIITDNAGYGSLASSNANLAIITPPILLTQSPLPTNQVVVYQNNLTLSVVASAAGMTNGFPLTYQWRLNGTNLALANSDSYTMLADTPNLGNYSVVVSNAAGSVTSLVWQVTMTYVGSYIDVGTLAYHLSTNLVAHTNLNGGGQDLAGFQTVYSGWTYRDYSGTNLYLMTNAVFSTNFWLRGVQGLSATCLGFSNGYAGDALVTMVSPRHCTYANHVHLSPGRFMVAFLDTNNIIYWRTNMENVFLSNDVSVGILNADLPPSVGFLPVIPTNFMNYFPTNRFSYVQGIGMNQDMMVFGQPMNFSDSVVIQWDSKKSVPFGLLTNWNVTLRGGDSSNPERLLIGNRLVLAAHNWHVLDGPSYTSQTAAINQTMHYLSTNNNAGSDYKLTPISLTNWPNIY